MSHHAQLKELFLSKWILIFLASLWNNERPALLVVVYKGFHFTFRSPEIETAKVFHIRSFTMLECF
jgi:hypothetical protein